MKTTWSCTLTSLAAAVEAISGLVFQCIQPKREVGTVFDHRTQCNASTVSSVRGAMAIAAMRINDHHGLWQHWVQILKASPWRHGCADTDDSLEGLDYAMMTLQHSTPPARVRCKQV